MRRRNDERGFAAAEWVAAVGLLLIPAYIAIMTATRIPEARSDVQVIATEAARSGAQANACTPTADGGLTANAAAQATARDLVATMGVSGDPRISTQGTDWRPGGTYKVTVTRDAPLVVWPGAEVFVPGLPSVSASHTEPIDTYRFFDDGDASCSTLDDAPIGAQR